MRMVIMMSAFISLACTGFAQSQIDLKKRIDLLEERIARLEAACEKQECRQAAVATKEQIVENERALAKARMRKDLDVYSSEDLSKIEHLYQVASKGWDSEAGKKSLEELIAKYDKANRTGCAVQYLGQMTQGDERVHYLNKAIESYSDCRYGNGVQVGAYARFWLAWQYKKDGNENKAKKLFAEIAKMYPNAIDHRGNLLSDVIAKENK